MKQWILALVTSALVFSCGEEGGSPPGDDAKNYTTVDSEALISVAYFEQIQNLDAEGNVLGPVRYEKKGTFRTGDTVPIVEEKDANGDQVPAFNETLEGYSRSLRRILLNGQEYYADTNYLLVGQQLAVVTGEEVNIRTGFKATDISTLSFKRGDIIGVTTQADANGRDLYRMVALRRDEAGNVTDYLPSTREFYIPKDGVSTRKADVELIQELNNLDEGKKEIWEQILTELRSDYNTSTFIKEVDELLLEISGSSSSPEAAVDEIFTWQEVAVERRPYQVMEGRLNLRSQPTTDSDIVVVLEDGTTVTSLAQTAEQYSVGGNTDFWYRVEYDGYEGWAFGAFLRFRSELLDDAGI